MSSVQAARRGRCVTSELHKYAGLPLAASLAACGSPHTDSATDYLCCCCCCCRPAAAAPLPLAPLLLLLLLLPPPSPPLLLLLLLPTPLRTQHACLGPASV